MWRRFLHWWAGQLPARFIDHAGAPYLERHLVGTWCGMRVYLHRFVASDPDGLHDHPFRHGWSWLLAGWYWEDRWGGRRRRRWCNHVGPNDFHRVELPGTQDVWTLFVHTARVRPWGFLRATGPAQHGNRFCYEPESQPTDPAFSDWSRCARGRDLRQQIRCIPAGRNAYSANRAAPSPHA